MQNEGIHPATFATFATLVNPGGNLSRLSRLSQGRCPKTENESSAIMVGQPKLGANRRGAPMLGGVFGSRKKGGKHDKP